MTYCESQKRASYKYRENNRDQYNDYMKEHIYKKYSNKIKAKRMGKYYLIKEMELFRQILL